MLEGFFKFASLVQALTKILFTYCKVTNELVNNEF